MAGGYPIGAELAGASDTAATATSKGTTVNCGAAAGAYGASYTQLLASTPADYSWVIVILSVRLGGFTSAFTAAVKIAVGAAAA